MNDSERNGAFTEIREALWKMYQSKRNLTHVEKKYCCEFAVIFVPKSFFFSEMVW